MKTIYLIGGTMGVGKTTVSQQLKKKLPNRVFLSRYISDNGKIGKNQWICS